MAHGIPLYAGVWENKPPGIYLLYSAVYHLAGASLGIVRILAAIAVLTIVWLTYRLALLISTEQGAAAAAVLAGLLFAVPFLEGTTANAEVFVAALSAGAFYFALARDKAGLAGLLMGGAILFKVVSGTDAAALGLVLLLKSPRAAIQYTVAAAIILLLSVLWAANAGILGPMVREAWLYDLGYVGHANGGGVPWLLLLKGAALVAITLPLLHRPFPLLWLAYAAAGALLSGRFFGHYALQAVVPFALAAALVLRGHPQRVHLLLPGLPAVFVLFALGSAALGWALAANGHDGILARRLQWYPNFLRWSVGAESRAAYEAAVDDQVRRNEGVAAALRRLPPGRLLIWGNTPWVYVLSHRLPATPYTSAWRDPPIPSAVTSLRRALRHGVPVLAVVVYPPRPAPPVPLARYLRVQQIGNAVIYARRSVSTAASTRSGTR